MKIRFDVEITEDAHPVSGTKTLLKQLAEDVASAVSQHDKVEGNAAECVFAEYL